MKRTGTTTGGKSDFQNKKSLISVNSKLKPAGGRAPERIRGAELRLTFK